MRKRKNREKEEGRGCIARKTVVKSNLAASLHTSGTVYFTGEGIRTEGAIERGYRNAGWKA
jgi:hypothetical protein